jgi:hypothetical protein
MVASPSRFSDIQNHWARLFIEGLANQGMISGKGIDDLHPKKRERLIHYLHKPPLYTNK